MKRSCILLLLWILSGIEARGQDYVKAIRGSASQAALFVYFTGDGGWNSFNTGVINELSKHGKHVVAINSKKYFWRKKSPEQTALELERLIRKYSVEWETREVIISGYSFGASIVPFVVAHLPHDVRKELTYTVCLSPSLYATFEVTVSTMLNLERGNSGLPFLSQLAKLKSIPCFVIFGKNGEEGSIRAFREAGVVPELLEGAHDYNDDFAAVFKKIVR